MYTVYILHSQTKSRFYIGQTNNLEDRIKRHNSAESLSTKSGVPWKLIYTIEFESRSEAVILETKIKKRGAKRYLEDINFKYKM